MVKGKGPGVILAVGLAALLLFTACAPGPPIEERKVVEIGMIAPLTGGAASTMQVAVKQWDNYFRNFEEKGVSGLSFPPGVAIKPIWLDDGGELARGISVYNRLLERGVPMVVLGWISTIEALKPRFEKHQVPAIALAVTDVMMYPPGWIYGFYPTESEKFAVLCDWIMENWQEERPPTVGLIGPDLAWGRACEVTGTAYARSIGVETLPMEFVPVVSLDSSVQLLRLADGGADFIYITTFWSSTLPIMRDAERLGLLDRIRFGGYENSQAIELIETLGPAAEGYFAARAYPWYKEVPAMADMFVSPDGRVDAITADGAMSLALIPTAIEAIRRAVEEVGYENLDGRAVKEALDSIKDFDPHGMGKPITYTPEDHRGSATVRIYEVQGGEAVSVTDWREAPMLVPEG
jgi:branched-chain amino acid transport system substrate-binding protein